MSDTGWIIAYSIPGIAIVVVLCHWRREQLAAWFSKLIASPLRKRYARAGSHAAPRRVRTAEAAAPKAPRAPIAPALFEDAAGEDETAADEQDPREPVFIPAADEKLADPELPADLPEQIEAIEYPDPGEDLGVYFEAVARLTGTRTGLEQTARLDGDDMTTVLKAVQRDPTLGAALRAAEEHYAELDAEHEQKMQRFEDAHREEVEAAGDTTDQDKRSFHEAGVDR